jgi:geranylgeranyl pyrophosphate synthase
VTDGARPQRIDDQDLRARLDRWRNRVTAELECCLPPADAPPARLHAAQRYAVLGPGKRIRPSLVYATAESLGLPLETVDDAACAVELIHAYSLVHDDLPAMDDDDLRRGRPTCHRAFDEATAILAGRFAAGAGVRASRSRGGLVRGCCCKAAADRAPGHGERYRRDGRRPGNGSRGPRALC